MANRNWANGGKLYAMHVKAVDIDCNFAVDDTAAIGISSLKGPAVSAVYMHSAAATPSGPNPAAGSIVVRLSDNYSNFFGFDFSIQSPASGSDLDAGGSALTAGRPYKITVLGTTTTAEWHTLGVPAGVSPAVGVSFIAAAAGAGSGSGKVQLYAAAGSGVASIELFGNPALSIAPNPGSNQGYGAQFIFQCRDYAGAIVAPVAGSIIQLKFYLSDSSIQIGSE